MIDKRIGKEKNKNNSFSNLRKRVTESHQNSSKSRLVKIGINECIKSIDKGDVEKMYISKDLKEPYFSILKEYNIINKVEFNYTNKKHSYVIKKRSQ